MDPSHGSSMTRSSSLKRKQGGYQIELSDGSVIHSHPETLSSFKNHCKDDALQLIHVSMPEKVQNLDKFISETKWFQMDNFEKMFESVDENNESYSGLSAIEANYKKLALEIIPLITKVKAELVQFLGILERIKLFIELNIPRIEDGNNFGVSIQEDIVAELSRIEESLLHIADSILKYYIGRAKLVSKVAKYPLLDDYKRTIVEIDLKQVLHLKINFLGIRNGYAILNDMIIKNMERILRPRSSNTGSMY